MLRVITMTAYRRPAYTREVLAALAECDGIEDWLLLPNVEPGNEEVIEAFRTWDACESRLVVNARRLGLNRNTYAAVHRAFEMRASVSLHLEDDTVPSPDALRYFDWAVREVLARTDGHSILLASGYNKPRREPPPHRSHDCETRPIWTPWGWRRSTTAEVADPPLVLSESEVLHLRVPSGVSQDAAGGVSVGQSDSGYGLRDGRKRTLS